VKCQTRPAAGARHRLEQSRRLLRFRAELVGEIEERTAAAGLEPNQDHQVSRLGTEQGENFFELVFVIDHEVAHGKVLESTLHGAPALDRMHEVGAGLGESLAHQANLAQGRGVEMTDTRPIEVVEHQRCGIGLDRVKHVTGKTRQEGRGRAAKLARPQAIDRVFRTQRRDQGLGVGESRSLKFVPRESHQGRFTSLTSVLGHPATTMNLDRPSTSRVLSVRQLGTADGRRLVK
jgi:hypothetical protein